MVHTDFVLRISLSVLLEFLIGLERQSGVGFLCSGVIFKDSGTAREINERRGKP